MNDRQWAQTYEAMEEKQINMIVQIREGRRDAHKQSRDETTFTEDEKMFITKPMIWKELLFR